MSPPLEESNEYLYIKQRLIQTECIKTTDIKQINQVSEFNKPFFSLSKDIHEQITQQIDLVFSS